MANEEKDMEVKINVFLRDKSDYVPLVDEEGCPKTILSQKSLAAVAQLLSDTSTNASPDKELAAKTYAQELALQFDLANKLTDDDKKKKVMAIKDLVAKLKREDRRSVIQEMKKISVSQPLAEELEKKSKLSFFCRPPSQFFKRRNRGHTFEAITNKCPTKGDPIN